MNLLNHGFIEGVGVSLSILLIIVLIRRGWKLYQVLSVSIVILAITGGNDLVQNLNTFYYSLTSQTAIYLVLMVIAITMLGHLHQNIGAMQKLVDQLRCLIRDPRILIMLFPAAISLFSTVPGGAVISAPMVEETGRDLKMPPLELAMSNMVYRHMIVLIYPFSAGLILASGLTGFSIAEYLSFSVPVVAIVFIIATILLLKRYPRPINDAKTAPENKNVKKNLAELLFASSPYLVAIILGLAFGVYFPLALLAGIIIALFIYLPRENRTATLKNRLKILLKGLNWSLALSILTIVIYKDFMIETASIHNFTHALLDLGIPLIAIILALSFFTGFITGNNAASLGITLPVLLPLLGPDMLTIRYLGIIYIFSYVGYLGSPVHLCTYVTNEYFKTPLYSLIKQVNVFGAITMIVSLTISIFY